MCHRPAAGSRASHGSSAGQTDWTEGHGRDLDNHSARGFRVLGFEIGKSYGESILNGYPSVSVVRNFAILLEGRNARTH